MLLLEPGGADTELGAAAGEDVERGDRLGQQARVTVGDAGNQEAEAQLVCAAMKPRAV